MEALQKYLSPIRLEIDQILLDPNNPRFSELGERLDGIPEIRFAEPRIQEITFQKMKDDRYGVSELKDTIKTIGFLPMDRLVVRCWNNTDNKYVVVEGNRRTAAIKWLFSLHSDGKITLEESQIENFKNIECLLLSNDAPPASTLVLPGLRHISGIKEWGAYQKAKAIFELRKNQRLSAIEAAQSIGLSTRAANKAFKCYLALEQMKTDDEWGDFAEPKYYTYFDEVFKKQEIKNWLSWNDTAEVFDNQDNLKDFYSWIVSTDENESKIREAKDIRDLAIVISDPAALHIFKSENGSLPQALARYQTDHPTDWMVSIEQAIAVLKNISIDALRRSSDTEMDKLDELILLAQLRKKDRESLL